MKPISIRMEEQILEFYKRVAEERGGNYQTIIKMDLKEIAAQKYKYQPEEVSDGKTTLRS